MKGFQKGIVTEVCEYEKGHLERSFSVAKHHTVPFDS